MKPLLADALILAHPGVLGFGNLPLSNDYGQCHVEDPVCAYVDEAERLHPASTSPQVHASQTSPLQGKWTGNCLQVLHLASSPRGLLHMHGFNTSIYADSKLATSMGGHQMLSNYHSRHQQLLRPSPSQSEPNIYPRPSHEPQNLQAGQKRKESEIDVHDVHSSNQVRRRITRACDQCNQLRTKCDGKHPCAHCLEINISCEYARAHKKRGRIPKDEIQNAVGTSGQREEKEPAMNLKYVSQERAPHENVSNQQSGPDTYSGNTQQVAIPNNMEDFMALSSSHTAPYYTNNPFHSLPQSMSDESIHCTGQPYQTMGMGSLQEFGFPLGDDYSVAFMGKAPMVDSPDWLALASPAFMGVSQPVPPRTTMEEPLRYPVLQALLPHIENILPQSLACDLLDQYFTSSTSAYMRPSNPYILGYVFRKKSILHPTSPRTCSLALLASMLWIAAQTSDAAFLNSQPDSRSRICQKLLELTISLLKPLVHSQSSTIVSDHASKLPADGTSLGALDGQTTYTGSPNRTQVDNIATYIHIATVVSASERKAASLRWWNAAWSLAREVRLGRELPTNPPGFENESGPKDTTHETNDRNELPEMHQTSSGYRRGNSTSQTASVSFVHEEEQEERRRVFWLVFMMDRHLSICYNKPLFFLNKECEALLQPMDDDAWQAGQFDQTLADRKRGLNVECTSHSIFGYFLPLMVILGEILDLNHARNRPRLGPSARQAKDWDQETQEIVELLEIYGKSLQDFAHSQNIALEHGQNDALTPSVGSTGTNESHAASEWALQTKTVVAYSTHIMHVLHILLTGKWDPIALLDDNDLWISSQHFVTATGHAVNAAEAVSDIIEYDPDLSFMPFFFGVYLLQGSFLLLLFADKLQGTVGTNVVKACETIVRAHEACVATLDTQYQVSCIRCLVPNLKC
jgi:xylanolytic transcriptional activator XlnR